MNMTTSPQGIAAIAKHEGIVPGPYLDSVRVWTYGVGHTAGAGAPTPSAMMRGMPADLDAELVRVAAVFRQDLKTFEDRVNQHVKVPLTQHQFDALVSFDFNTGGVYYKEKATGRWRNATLVDTLNKGDYRTAGLQFMNWSSPPEIVGRRTEEKDLFLTGVYPKGNTSVWPVDNAGRVTYKAVRTLTPQAVVALVTGPVPAPAPPQVPPVAPAAPVSVVYPAGSYRADIDAAGTLRVTSL